MRKAIVIVLLLAFVVSCGSNKTVRTSKKIIKGEWTLSSITYSKEGDYNVTLLNDVSKACFEGSTWRFIPNNNTGVYTITNNDCYPGDRNFIFLIQKIDESTGYYDFLLKPTNEKKKSVDNTGFRLHLNELTQTNMVWTQSLYVNDEPFQINMNFIKL